MHERYPPKKYAGGTQVAQSFHAQLRTWMIQFLWVDPPKCWRLNSSESNLQLHSPPVFALNITLSTIPWSSDSRFLVKFSLITSKHQATVPQNKLLSQLKYFRFESTVTAKVSTVDLFCSLKKNCQKWKLFKIAWIS